MARKLTCRVGDRFGALTAVRRLETDAGGNQRWEFECRCGTPVRWRVSTVTYNLRKFGWTCCPSCYRSAGGWRGLQANGGHVG